MSDTACPGRVVRVVARSCAIALTVCAVTACGQREQLPDWSGWWTTREGQSPAQLLLDNSALFQPAARARLDAVVTPGANISATGLYCRQYRFVGDNGGAIEDVEFLFTPGRLTITNESGLLRRIALDGSPLREDPEPSNAGTSVGKWEGDTLVVETIGLHGDSVFPAPLPGGPLIGDRARVTERFRMIRAGQLEVRTELAAPEMLKAPLSFRTVYGHDANHISRDLDICATNDRSIDPATGLQRFDLTPPADLAPPPAT